MTKTISLADDAYAALVAVKREDESFSELARRAAVELSRRRLFDPSIKAIWNDQDAEALIRRIYEGRDDTLEPRVRWP